MPNMVAKLTYVFDGGGAMHSQFCISPTILNTLKDRMFYPTKLVFVLVINEIRKAGSLPLPTKLK